MKTGIELIAEERTRQIEQEGWTPEHDDMHNQGELAGAARAYAYHAEHLIGGSCKFTERPPQSWPWELGWWKPSTEPVRALVKAGALIAAEIDRLQRLQKR